MNTFDIKVVIIFKDGNKKVFSTVKKVKYLKIFLKSAIDFCHVLSSQQPSSNSISVIENWENSGGSFGWIILFCSSQF